MTYMRGDVWQHVVLDGSREVTCHAMSTQRKWRHDDYNEHRQCKRSICRPAVRVSVCAGGSQRVTVSMSPDVNSQLRSVIMCCYTSIIVRLSTRLSLVCASNNVALSDALPLLRSPVPPVVLLRF